MASAVFFLRRERLFDRACLPDLFVNGDKGTAQLLVLPECRDLVLRLALRGMARETLGHRLARGFIGKARVRSMPGVIGTMAVTRGIAASTAGSRDGARAKSRPARRFVEARKNAVAPKS